MRITRVEIENFRSIRRLEVELGETTVFVGPNNAGKTAILDALRIALARRWGQGGAGFSEYDIHMADEKADPRESSGVRIDLHAEETQPGEWSDAIAQDLGDVMRLDPATNRRSISLRTRYLWDSGVDAFESSWEFLGAARQPLVEASARRVNLERFWRYLPVFHLDALRDAKDEFSPRSSQFWTRLLKRINVPRELEAHALQVLGQINRQILDADPRLTEIAETLSGATRIAARDRDGGLDLQMAPLKMWDLLSRAEIILRNETSRPWLPLRRQGQGIQSLSVIFLFQAFVEHLLAALFASDSEPVLALEEPETHLHPQAVRTLWEHIVTLPGQKIVTTHSPYFVQHVPFRDLRLVRLTDAGTEARSASISDDELRRLETQARRMRGEIFFAERWLMVEGPSDHVLVHAIAHALDYDLDRHGVSVIDAKNNGNPANFAALARSLGIPWLAVFDGDEGGKQFIRNMENRDFDKDELTERCRCHPDGDLEMQMIADGLGLELRTILDEIGIQGAGHLDDRQLLGVLENHKTAYASRLAERVRSDFGLAERMPAAFREAIMLLKGLK